MDKLKEKIWDPVMDSDRNPLSALPMITRCHIMIVLSVLWSTLFCFMIGWMMWLPYWASGHVLAVLLGSLVTNWTFRNARIASHRDLYRSADGRSARYDDLWGA